MQITLRLTESLHAKVREKARELGRSVNSYLVQLIQSDLQLPESRVPAETSTAKKSAVQVDAEKLLNWSLEHQGEEPDDETIMQDFGWSERMIPPRRTLFKALYRKDPKIKELRENLVRQVFDALREMTDVFKQVRDFNMKDFAAKFHISMSYMKIILKDLDERNAIRSDAESIGVLGFPCGSEGCNGVVGVTKDGLTPCRICGQAVISFPLKPSSQNSKPS